jgi:hypothetical protein
MDGVQPWAYIDEVIDVIRVRQKRNVEGQHFI